MQETSFGIGFSVVVAQSERVVAYRLGEFRALLGPGLHRFFGPRKRWHFVAITLGAPWWPEPERSVMAADPRVAPHVESRHVGDGQRGLLYRDGRIVNILRPSHYVWLKSAIEWRIDLVDIMHEPRVPVELQRRLAGHADEAANVKTFDVPDGAVGLEYLDKVLSPTPLPPGRYAYWIGARLAHVEVIDLREQAYEVSGQELMTLDKVSIRVNLSVRAQVSDPVAAVSQQSNYSQAVYRELQLALRAEVGALTLEALLERKDDLGAAIAAKATAACQAFGLKIISGGVRDIILPGEMRALFNHVIEAEKRAQANAIMRREETAATRSLLNTAKLLENNPLLLRLKELEATERIAEKISHLSVYGGFDNVLPTVAKVVEP